MTTKPTSKKTTIKSLNETYSDFQVEKNYRSYTVTHKPTGKKSCCIIRTLETAKVFIENTIKIDWYLDNRSNYRLPNE